MPEHPHKPAPVAVGRVVKPPQATCEGCSAPPGKLHELACPEMMNLMLRSAEAGGRTLAQAIEWASSAVAYNFVFAVGQPAPPPPKPCSSCGSCGIRHREGCAVPKITGEAWENVKAGLLDGAGFKRPT